jgi:hypothetical protein
MCPTTKLSFGINHKVNNIDCHDLRAHLADDMLEGQQLISQVEVCDVAHGLKGAGNFRTSREQPLPQHTLVRITLYSLRGYTDGISPWEFQARQTEQGAPDMLRRHRHLPTSVKAIIHYNSFYSPPLSPICAEPHSLDKPNAFPVCHTEERAAALLLTTTK